MKVLFTATYLMICFLSNLIFCQEKPIASFTDGHKNAQKFYTKGLHLVNKKKIDEALIEFEKVLQVDSTFTIVWVDMGICYKKTKKINQAIECFEKALFYKQNEIYSLQSLADVYEELREFQKASEYYLRWIELYPEDTKAYYGASRMFYLCREEVKGLDYICQAYDIYRNKYPSIPNEFESGMVETFYNHFKSRQQLKIFNDTIKKYNIQFKHKK